METEREDDILCESIDVIDTYKPVNMSTIVFTGERERESELGTRIWHFFLFTPHLCLSSHLRTRSERDR